MTEVDLRVRIAISDPADLAEAILELVALERVVYAGVMSSQGHEYVKTYLSEHEPKG